MKPDEDILAFLLKLNLKLAAKEAKGEAITPPGLPAFVPEPESFVSRDCVRAPDDLEADGSTTQSAAESAHFYGKEKGPPYRVKQFPSWTVSAVFPRLPANRPKEKAAPMSGAAWLFTKLISG